VHHKSIIYNKPTRCNSGSIVFINNYKYAVHVSDAPCVHHQEHLLVYYIIQIYGLVELQHLVGVHTVAIPS